MVELCGLLIFAEHLVVLALRHRRFASVQNVNGPDPVRMVPLPLAARTHIVNFLRREDVTSYAIALGSVTVYEPLLVLPACLMATSILSPSFFFLLRSEERRVGKECRS